MFHFHFHFYSVQEIFFFLFLALWHVGSNTHALQGKCGVLTTGLAGKSLSQGLFISTIVSPLRACQSILAGEHGRWLISAVPSTMVSGRCGWSRVLSGLLHPTLSGGDGKEASPSSSIQACCSCYPPPQDLTQEGADRVAPLEYNSLLSMLSLKMRWWRPPSVEAVLLFSLHHCLQLNSLHIQSPELWFLRLRGSF